MGTSSPVHPWRRPPKGWIGRTASLARILRKAGAILVGFLVWHFVARAVGSSLILPFPREVISAFFKLAAEPRFWLAVGGTTARVVAAFLLSALAGTLTGILAGIYPGFSDFLSPYLTAIRSTPVLALILLAMFWLPTSLVPVFSAFLMAYPVVHTSAYTGFLSLDEEYEEMARLFRVPKPVSFVQMRLPSAGRHLLAAAGNAMGLCWKVVVAGEVLAQPARALGTGLQDMRLALETPGVFAWAFATILLCGLSEAALGRAFPGKAYEGRQSR
ncbi:MAG TPA: ABC transporter permease subunit [Rectinemataceae bacterium]